MDGVSTGSGSDRVIVLQTRRRVDLRTRSLPLPVLTSPVFIALDALRTGRYRLDLNDHG